jgi:hypothetical protein
VKKTIALILCISVPSWGAIGFVQHQGNTTAALTVTSTGTGDSMVVYCMCTTGYCTGVTDNATGGSSTYTEVLGARGLLTGFQCNAFVAGTLKSGATTVTCAGSGAGETNAFEYSGVNTSSPVDVSTGTVNGSANGTISTGKALTTTNAGDVISSYIVPSGSASGVSSPYGHLIENGDGVSSADYTPGTVVTSSATWTGSPGNFGNSALALMPASNASVAPNKGMSINGGKVTIQ